MDIKRFIDQRKKLGYSQVVLSKGICTQSTLSKFENNGQIPSFTILKQLCDRLGLTIDDLNKSDPASLKYIHKLLNEVELALMIEHFPAAVRKLDQVKVDELKSPEDKMQYYYLKGMIYTLTNNKTSTTLFNFTKILDELDEQHRTIYSQLAYLGSGILYARRNSMDHADFFLSKVIAFLRSLDKEELFETDEVYYLRIMTMFYYCAEYHALSGRYAASDEVLSRAIQMCAAKHVTYFLPRIKLLQAENAISAGASSAKVKDLLTEALVFARFNANSVVEVQVAALRSNLAKNIQNS
jgi:transcriptional regulator with XRE-family HTH domain